MAGEAHDPAHRLRDHVVGGALRVGSRLAEARDRRHHQPRMLALELLPAVAEPLHHARTEVLDEHVGALEQPLEHAAVGRGVEIEREALLAAVERDEVGGRVADEGADPARVVAAAGRLDLDHARTQIGEHLGAERTGEHARQIDDEDPGERARGRHRLATGALETFLERAQLVAQRAPACGCRTGRSTARSAAARAASRPRRPASAPPDPRASRRRGPACRSRRAPAGSRSASRWPSRCPRSARRST